MNYAIVLAGGKGQRFGNEQISKQFIELTGVPMIVYSLKIAEKNKNIDEVCIVVAEKEEDKVRHWIREYGITKVKYFARPGKNGSSPCFMDFRKYPQKAGTRL